MQHLSNELGELEWQCHYDSTANIVINSLLLLPLLSLGSYGNAVRAKYCATHTLTLYTTRPVVNVSAECTHCLLPAPKHCN